ncbi:hypothetical protein SERLA73DRAFT_175547 [Serpula lacrymans var. lacrymans S7.3]|uniref:Uncharacterized protein n=2 Tax=Serpula lacrymans var. lacrymans TaxID=341189 RepID=F8PKE9_SERL3|nr:uncharacterized protein SERLADRAFT_458056 [Serpula lacrymans var. lacrymans S7.9]EGO03863.1 hypothetical protein SERLA73DRAFT_175547 [Serpula lacrymans var. lacrymans S7.3]EGO29789.1 hypothetical protein SERLADRAFT_458056 [Serpula lacrymans var. lacrymans S7.9]
MVYKQLCAKFQADPFNRNWFFVHPTRCGVHFAILKPQCDCTSHVRNNRRGTTMKTDYNLKLFKFSTKCWRCRVKGLLPFPTDVSREK